jgi:hypothetical protein
MRRFESFRHSQSMSFEFQVSSCKLMYRLSNLKLETWNSKLICWPGARVTEQRTFNPLGAGLSPAGSTNPGSNVQCPMSNVTRQRQTLDIGLATLDDFARCSSTVEHSIDNRAMTVRLLPPRPRETVQGPMSKVESAERGQTLEIGLATLDRSDCGMV